MESEDGTEEPDISAAVTADTSDTLPPGGERQMGEGAGCGEGRGGGCVNGLWSVNNVNCLPSNRNRKWQMAELAASSSLSKVEYWISGAESFLLKKANGTQDEEILCWRTVPTWVYEASTASKIGAEGTGWSNLGTWSRADLVAEIDCSICRVPGEILQRSLQSWVWWKLSKNRILLAFFYRASADTIQTTCTLAPLVWEMFLKSTST